MDITSINFAVVEDNSSELLNFQKEVNQRLRKVTTLLPSIFRPVQGSNLQCVCDSLDTHVLSIVQVFCSTRSPFSNPTIVVRKNVTVFGEDERSTPKSLQTRTRVSYVSFNTT